MCLQLKREQREREEREREKKKSTLLQFFFVLFHERQFIVYTTYVCIFILILSKQGRELVRFVWLVIVVSYIVLSLVFVCPRQNKF